ncbi:MAG: hypothetical protein JOZ31_26385 [Verrucomicrobia bacterium]|nr:hypothetical protein [Verrucomicrobiota bacterium]MBV8485611.1 hypothetical protein [Verrucomicrobiota bacterium]
MSDDAKPTAKISLPEDFLFGEVPTKPEALAEPRAGVAPAVPVKPIVPPSLGPLAAFVGTWTGTGFNTIFRPDNSKTPTNLPTPVPAGPPPGTDNVLELNLTSETLSFSPSLGSVPNRGSDPQGDVFLNGVPYLQVINDVTNPGQKVGIHVEPGLWMSVPSTDSPAEGPTVFRMGSIPHGTTIQAQGTSKDIVGPPTIPPVDITPFTTVAPGNVTTKIEFASQTATKEGTPRIPQDLTPFIANGTITQAILDDPNSILRNHIATQNIVSTTAIFISTNPASPLFGGGTDNIAFLLGADNDTPLPSRPNAQALQMTATFWIETVEETITVPIFNPGDDTLLIEGKSQGPGKPVPVFSVTPPVAIPAPRQIKVTSTQIQYSQLVILNFARLSWPHVSVATLVPADPIVVPAAAFN